MTTQRAPIALFVYNRPGHLKKTVDALRKNILAGESELYVFSDAPKDKKTLDSVLQVREYAKTISGFLKVTIIERDSNLGLAGSIIKGVSELTAQYGRVIVLEDDLVTSPFFLNFMNDGLSAYKDEDGVISICGYMYPVNKMYADSFFFRIPDSWGWATWKRGWDLFEADGKKLYGTLKARKLFRSFNLNGSFDFIKMLQKQIKGKNDSWAVRWYASAFLNGKLSLYPRKSLVMNIGFDGSGRHGGVNDYFRSELLNEPITVHKIPHLEDKRVMREVSLYLMKQRFNIGHKALEFFRKGWYNKILRKGKENVC